MSYEKHKDAAPEKTVARIKDILQDVGIELFGELDNPVTQVYSINLLSKQFPAFVNGKGTQAAYCMASAYAEAMERIQNGYFYNKGELTKEASEYGGFERWPDETRMSVASAAELAPCVFEEMRESYVAGSEDAEPPEKEKIILFWQNYLQTEQVSCVEFFRVRDGKCVLMPEQLISAVCGSNGLCAGNTPQEAICQGICEAFERHVKHLVFHGKLSMPEIPRSYISVFAPELVDIMEAIEARGPFRVYVRDAALGKQYPVVCVLLVDLEKQRYHIKFGSHVSFPVALERCLTELLQGYKIGNESVDAEFLTPWSREEQKNALTAENQESMIRSDVGAVPDACLAANDSQEFAPWNPATGVMSNADALRYLTELLFAQGFELYVRDNSFLGFPTYRVYIPGMTATHLPRSYKSIRDRRIESALRQVWKYGDHFEEHQFISALEFTKRRRREWEQICYGSAVPREAIAAGICVKLKKRLEAAAYLWQIRGDEGLLWHCAAREMELKEDGCPVSQRDQLLEMFFGDVALAFVKEYWREHSAEDFSFARLFDRSKEQTELHGEVESSETGGELIALHMRLKDRMIAGMPKQEMLKAVF